MFFSLDVIGPKTINIDSKDVKPRKTFSAQKTKKEDSLTTNNRGFFLKKDSKESWEEQYSEILTEFFKIN